MVLYTIIIYYIAVYIDTLRYLFNEDNTKDCSGSKLFDQKLPIEKESIDEIKHPKYVRILKINDKLNTPSWYKAFTLLLCDGGDKNVGSKEVSLIMMPDWLSIVPILLLLIFAFVLRNALLSLSIGLYMMSIFISGNPFHAFLLTCQYFVDILSDANFAKIIYIIFFISGMIALVQKSGGAEGLTKLLKKFASTRRRTMIISYFFGIFMFIDGK